MSVENSGIFYEYGADFATAGSKKYMQKVTKIVGGVDFFLTFAPVHITSRHCNRWDFCILETDLSLDGLAGKKSRQMWGTAL